VQSKRSGRVEVLRGVESDLHCGEVHVLAGENGAAKSTPINILGGALGRSKAPIAPGEVVRHHFRRKAWPNQNRQPHCDSIRYNRN
jgi:ABC-type sugar transport system ATPase subunit